MDGAAGAHGMGADPVPLRQRSRGRGREDAARPLVHQAHVAVARPSNPRAYGRDHASRPRLRGRESPRSGGVGRRRRHGRTPSRRSASGRNPMMISVFLAVTLLTAPPAASAEAGGRPTMEGVARADLPGYRIGPEDLLQVSVWGNEAVSRTVPVRPDGRISLPLL